MTGIWLVSYIIMWVVLAVLVSAVFALYHYFGQLYLNSEQGRSEMGPDVGMRIPELELRSIDGTNVTFPGGGEALIAFVDVECDLCSELLPQLRQFALERRDIAAIAIVAGTEESVTRFTAPVRSSISVVVDARSRYAVRCGVSAYPFVVAVDREGVVVAKALANDRRDLERVAAPLWRSRREPVAAEEVVA
jgi:Redoxin